MRFIFLITSMLILIVGLYYYSPELNQWLTSSKLSQKSEETEDLIYFFVTITENKHADYTFSDINQMDLLESLEKGDPQLEIVFQEGTKEGPEDNYFGYGETKSNALIELRGNTTRNAVQKSYKIRLNNDAGLWNGKQILNLNKHPFDFLKVRNKLSFDYFDLIPNIPSLKTQFVQLYVKDLTKNPPDRDFTDYGLFTLIEEPNKRFLVSAEMDPDGYLYKAKSFEFHRYPNKLRSRYDSLYDEKEFERILQIEGRSYHEKLLMMLEDVNNEQLSINQVIDKHFDRDNYLTWLAVNILFGNLDTSSQNFYLYSPLYSDKWYFLPWDYDGAWDFYWQRGSRQEYLPPWREGIQNYGSVVLHRRFFQDPNNVKELTQKIESLMSVINEENTRDLLSFYYPVVQPIITRPPDSKEAPVDISRYDEQYWDLIQVPMRNRERFYHSLEKPMPFFLGEPEIKEKKILFRWQETYDPQGDKISYLFQLSIEPSFSSIMYEQEVHNRTQLTIPMPDSGMYYWRVIVSDHKGNKQIAFDSYEPEGAYYHGVKAMEVP